MSKSKNGANGKPRIGVYVCHCGTNISATVDCEDVAQWAADQLKLEGVVVARDYKFMCSSLGQELIADDIKEQKLDRVVVAACSPHLHEQTFRNACKQAGLNQYLCELVSIREQVSWVLKDKVEGTQQGEGGHRRRCGACEVSRAARTADRAHPSGDTSGRRRHRRHPGDPGTG